MQSSASRCLILILALAGVVAAACSDSGGTATSGSGGGITSSSATGSGGHGGNGNQSVTLTIDPPNATETITLGTPGATIQFHAFATVGSGPKVDVSKTAQWVINPELGMISSTGLFTPAGLGGKIPFAASYEGKTANASVTLKLSGSSFDTGTDATTQAAFAAATADTNPADAPAIEYPNDGTVVPANLPTLDAQWTQASDNAVYEVEFTVPDILDVSFYTKSRDLNFDPTVWKAIGQSTYDIPLTMVVRGIGSSGQVSSSGPAAITITADSIDQSAIYVWQSSTGTFHILDLQAATDTALPNNSPALAAGQPCSGCHRVSRDGERFSYTYNGGNFEFGTLAYDATSQSFLAKIVPSTSFRGTYAAFNPLESTQAAGMLLTIPDSVPANTKGNVGLQMFDPDSGAPITSDFATAAGQISPAVGQQTMMPDWSPDGSFVVFAAYDNTTNWVRDLGDDIVSASIVEMPVSFDATSKSFHFGTPKTLVQGGPGTAPDTDENDFLPSISPDGTAVAFTRASGWWSLHYQTSLLNLTGQIAVVRRSDNTVLELVKGSNGPGTNLSSTWPQWAPSLGSKYAWLAYGTERPYGHLLTPASPENAQCGFVQGQNQCKHLWVMAVDRAKLAKGTVDPSSPPFWIPGQTIAAQYVGPQWTKAVVIPQ